VRHALRHSEEFPPKRNAEQAEPGELFLCFSMRMIATAMMDDAFNFIDKTTIFCWSPEIRTMCRSSPS
jgi:hypothetical protein